MSKHLRPAVLTYHRQFLLHGLSDHVGRGDVFNPQRRINGFMFFSLSVLNLEDHLGLVILASIPVVSGLHHPAGMPQVTAAQVLHRHTRWDCWVSS